MFAVRRVDHSLGSGGGLPSPDFPQGEINSNKTLENEIMSNEIRGWVARGAKQPLEPFAYNGSLNGGPTMTSAMLDFAARHKITPQVERFPMSK